MGRWLGLALDNGQKSGYDGDRPTVRTSNLNQEMEGEIHLPDLGMVICWVSIGMWGYPMETLQLKRFPHPRPVPLSGLPLERAPSIPVIRLRRFQDSR